MAVNYDDALAQIQGLGLQVDHLVADGKTRRFRVNGQGREKRGWTLLHEWRNAAGDIYIVGSFGVWHGNDPGTIKIELAANQLSAEEKAALANRLREDRKRAKAARANQAERAARRAARVWSKSLTAPPERGVEYLERKAVHNFGLRYTASGALVVPMCDTTGRVHGLQFILPKGHPHRKKIGRDKTYWPAGLAVSGHFHAIGNPAMASICLIAEGYATAATVHQATGLPAIVAFSANNLEPVAKAIASAHPRAQILICADDDYLTDGNPGCAAAAAAALSVGGRWVAPVFPSDRQGQKLTDFNDLSLFPDGGLHLVGDQLRTRIDDFGWADAPTLRTPSQGDGETLKPLLNLDEAAERYALIYGGKATLFDHWENLLVPKSDVLDMLPDHGWRDWKLRSDRQVVRMDQVGFDPAGEDARIRCNLWGGWPTAPAAGDCEHLLDLLSYLCKNEPRDVFDWVLRWLAYPIQNPGAKMKTALVFHGPQGVGKNLFFEAVMAIYGEYGRIVDQSAIEDKFNDWASRKLFLVADEVVARLELYHLKNRLKGLVTGTSIRINPKNVSPHDETNHVNIVFLSNERQPLVIERDDRRYCVVWVPEKLDQSIYDKVGACIKNGGVAALHQYLLDFDLSDFRPWTAPPVTRAKSELIDVSLESTERFMREWSAGETDWPFTACASMDLYQAYRKWAGANGVAKPRESNHFLGLVNKMPGWSVRPCHVYRSQDMVGDTRSQKMVIPKADLLQAAGQARNPEEKAADWHTRCFFRFNNALHADAY